MADRKISSFLHLLIFALTAASLLTGCGGGQAPASDTDTSETANDAPEKDTEKADPGKKRESLRQFLLPEASGTVVYGIENISIDASNTAEGYVMVQYGGSADKVKMQITIPDGTEYTYNLAGGSSYESFPLSGGDGAYHIEVLEHAYDDMYALAFAQDLDVTLNDGFKPFLYPNQYAWYTQESQAAALALELSDSSPDDLGFVENVYLYVTGNITYDKELAASIPAGYIPDVDRTLSAGTGICFDYAALMTAMLRSQGIPTKLEVGYSGEAYHAWIDVYLEESGWVDKVIEFDGQDWTLMDPTLAAGNNRSSVGAYIGDGSNYTTKYSY